MLLLLLLPPPPRPPPLSTSPGLLSPVGGGGGRHPTPWPPRGGGAPLRGRRAPTLQRTLLAHPLERKASSSSSSSGRTPTLQALQTEGPRLHHAAAPVGPVADRHQRLLRHSPRRGTTDRPASSSSSAPPSCPGRRCRWVMHMLAADDAINGFLEGKRLWLACCTQFGAGWLPVVASFSVLDGHQSSHHRLQSKAGIMHDSIRPPLAGIISMASY